LGRKFYYPFACTGNVCRPFIPVRIRNPFEEDAYLDLQALLDSGADSCVFPQFAAEATLHNLKADAVIRYISQGVGQTSVTVYQHTFIIELFDQHQKNIIWKSEPQLHSCIDHDEIPPLLGFNDFMSQFVITFNYRTKMTTLELP
jgi:hypothetical protein